MLKSGSSQLLSTNFTRSPGRTASPRYVRRFSTKVNARFGYSSASTTVFGMISVLTDGNRAKRLTPLK